MKNWALLFVTAISLLATVSVQAEPSSVTGRQIQVMFISAIEPGSIKVVKAEDMTKAWQCPQPCYSVTLGFTIIQPQTNYKFVGLIQSGPRDKAGRYVNLAAVSARLNTGAITMEYRETVEVTLPQGVIPGDLDYEKIVLNNETYVFRFVDGALKVAK